MSAPMRVQVEPEDARQDTWRLTETPVETKDLNSESEQENEHISPGPFVVRTLKNPPEIWDLVHEAPGDFHPGGAFVARLTSSKTNVLLLTLAVMFLSGLCFFGVKTLRDGRNRDGAAAEVQEAPGTIQNVSSEVSEAASAPVNAGLNPQLRTQSNTESGSGDAVNTASPSTVQEPAKSEANAASTHPVLPNSVQPTGETVSNFSKLTASVSGGADALPVIKRVAVGSSWRNADDSSPASKENEIATAPDTNAAPQTSHAPQAPQTAGIKENPEKSSSLSAATKKTSDPTSNPGLTAPPTSSSAPNANAPKAKVIQWP